jgi:DNA-binding PadR family transcriptional regulator
MKGHEINAGMHQDLYSNLIHLYVLHHACRQPTFGLQIIEEVARLGYKLSPGTMYPLLDALEKKGLLRSREERTGRTVRRIYRATPAGRKAYVSARAQVERLLDVVSEVETKGRKKYAKKGRSQ